MTPRHWIAAALAAVALVSGCGSDGGGGDDGAGKPPPVARPEDFPKPAGRSLADIARKYGTGGPTLLRAGSEFTPGKNRFPFGLFDRSRAQISDAPVALYFAQAGGAPAKGPFPASWESLAVKPQFLSRGVQSDHDAAKSASCMLDGGTRVSILARSPLTSVFVGVWMRGALSPTSGG